MPLDDTLTWIEVSDFSPGIYDPRGTILNSGGYDMQKGPSQSAPLGAAQLLHADGSSVGTHHCICAPGKGLIGAPAKNTAAQVTRAYSAIKASGTFPAAETRAVITASALVTPIMANRSVGTVFPSTAPFFQDQLFVSYSQFHDPASGTAYQNRQDVETYKLFNNPFTVVSLYGGGIEDTDRKDGTKWAAPFYHAFSDYTATVSTYAPYSYWVMYVVNNTIQGGHVTHIIQYPGTGSSASDAISTLAANYNSPELIFSHEGRLCFTDDNQDGLARFGAAAGIPSQNDIGYYAIRDSTGTPFFLDKPIEENETGIRVAVSMNANELLIIKSVGGGAVISGDLDFPTVRKLPSLHSPGMMYAKPITTPLGVFYGGNSGVFLWNGADNSVAVNDQMDGAFWDPYAGYFKSSTPTTLKFGHHGGFGFCHPWVLLPSFFMYDTRFSSWWLLDNPTVIYPSFWMHGTSQGHILAVYPEINDAHSVVADRYDPEVQADHWSWTSQPMTPQLWQVMTVREVQMMVTVDATATGTCSVVISIRGINSVDTSNQTLVADGKPHAIRAAFSTDCEDIVISFDASSGTGPAPRLHYFKVGYQYTANNPQN